MNKGKGELLTLSSVFKAHGGPSFPQNHKFGKRKPSGGMTRNQETWMNQRNLISHEFNSFLTPGP